MKVRFSTARRVAGAVGATTLSLGSASAWAGAPLGGSVVYGPLAGTPVPTLGEWTLGLMALLMAVVAFRALRGRVNNRLLSNMALVGGAVAATVAGQGLLQEVKAAYYAEHEMTSPSGGTITGILGLEIVNNSGVPQQIKAITPDPSVEVRSPSMQSPQCMVNSIVATGGRCYVDFMPAGPQ